MQSSFIQYYDRHMFFIMDSGIVQTANRQKHIRSIKISLLSASAERPKLPTPCCCIWLLWFIINLFASERYSFDQLDVLFFVWFLVCSDSFLCVFNYLCVRRERAWHSCAAHDMDVDYVGNCVTRTNKREKATKKRSRCGRVCGRSNAFPNGTFK